MVTFRVLLLIIFLCSAPMQVDAAAYGTGQVTQIGGQGFGPNTVYFGIAPAPVNRASCNSHGTYQFILDMSTADGRALYAMLMAAVNTSSIISVQGSGTCPSGASVETVSYWSRPPQ